MSATDRRELGLDRPDAFGRHADCGRATSPSSINRSNNEDEPTALNRATGTPRSVTTTSPPLRTSDSHSLRCARNSVTATSMPQLYRYPLPNLYGLSAFNALRP